MKPVFGTKTYPNHMSIATGLFQETHGIVHNNMFDPEFNATFDEPNEESRWWDSGSLPIWTANQGENDGKIRNSGVIMWPGSFIEYSKRPGVFPKYIKRYEPKVNLTECVNLIISWLTSPSDPANLIFAYFNQPDETSHMFGPFSPQVKEQVKLLDSQFVGQLIQLISRHPGLEDKVNLIFLSDHGMSEITEDRVIEMNKFIPRSYYDMFGRSPLWNIFPKPGKKEDVYQLLAKASSTSGHFQVFKKHNVPSEYHYRNHRRIGEIVVIADDGWDIADEKESLKKGSGSVWGNHGFNNSVDSMKPLFLAIGPAFKSSFDLDDEFENIDLYPMMCVILHLLPLERFPSQGNMRITHQMLVPITRAADSSPDHIFSMFSTLFLSSAVLIVITCCFVVCFGMGRGKAKRRNETTWDPGVTDFDFGDHSTVPADLKMRILKQHTSTQVPESILLLDDLDDEDEDFEELRTDENGDHDEDDSSE
jgi:ectonucleotide pyrophosphatase/phosphodiesterase family protein 5